MQTKKYILYLAVTIMSILALCLTNEADAAGVDDIAVEVKGDGTILRGSDFEADKPVFRPAYQGNYETLFKDVIGPQGPFTGFYAHNNETLKHMQMAKAGESLILKNIGSFEGQAVALKITFGYDMTFRQIGIVKDGSILLNILNDTFPVLYQLVYDKPDYPVVRDIYLDLPAELTVSAENNVHNTLSTVKIGSSNLKKYYLMLPDSWWTKMTRNYALKNMDIPNIGAKDIFEFSPKFVAKPNEVVFPSSIVTNNNEQTLITLNSALAYIARISLFKTSQKTPYVPQYLPVRVNILGNSTKFEANYDVGQTVTDTYDTFLPDSLKIIVEDQEGYFNKVDQKSFVFKDKNGIDITNLITVNKVSSSKLELVVSSDSLKKLKSNQINIKLNLSDLNIPKVLANFDKENQVYDVPLTFYNIRTVKGIEKKSEETKVDATIIPNIYGEPKPIDVLVGTSTRDLDPKDLIENPVTTIPDDELDVSFVGVQEFTAAKTYNVSVQLASRKSVGLTKTVTVPVTAKMGSPITSAYFENQSWLITEINRQLAPKKIDVDVFESDLAKITNITLISGPEYPSEHIPVNIGNLTNLNVIRIGNRRLIGSLPKELGKLSKLTYLSIFGNTFEGGIPTEIGNLTQLTLISLDENNLTGTVPPGIAALPKLNQIYLNNNKLSGQLPEFPMNMTRISVETNQLTYNLPNVPTFITSAKYNSYSKTFIDGLQLSGSARVFSKGTSIKPFNSSDTGYFNLKANQGATSVDLYDEHTYTIKNAVSGKIYYTGKKDLQATIPYEKGISYQIILDEAEKNPKNVVVIQGKEDEFKFEETPASMSITSKLGSTKQPVVLDGKLEIFDNRENKNWKLSITPSKLTQSLKTLKGEYSYSGKDGIAHSIATGQKFVLEKGKSDSINEIISISNSWDGNQGLNYTAYKSNYVGDYKGTVNWTLEDAP